MSFLWHDDPLAGLPEIAPHPGRSESSSSALSSPPTSPIVRQIDTDVDDILSNYRPIHAGDDTAKVLRAFVDNLSGQGLSTLQSEIHATNPHQLRQLRNFLTDALLKPMAAAGGKQPPVTPSPNESEFAMTQIEGSSRTAQKSLKEECLRRDGNRCVALGVIDSTAYTNMPPGERKGTKCANTQCSYILPFALSNIDKRNATQTKNHETTWWALYRYFPALKNKIGANTINQPSNAITLISELHREFGQFTFGFKATNEEHKYRMEILDDAPYYTSQVPAFVIVPQEDAEVQRPDPDILDVHMRIGRILQVSGIGFAIRQSFARGNSCVYNIASDGSTDLERILSDKMLLSI
ncbi:hypothetical protein B0J18DRAFT_418470 [Chaetomium sp. MPI-SDFR-AT-0129]|nr:hypothetical protein B0J18DRAFT_418470 [Chaetomium sp. MPI-SDFR-AT-0129]